MKLATSNNEIGSILHHAYADRESFTLKGNGISAHFVAVRLNTEPCRLDTGRWFTSLDLEQVSEISQVKPWDGEGHPPVGTVCEWHPNVHGWVTVTILGRDGDCTWYRVRGEEASQTCRHMAFFRPIQTPEQIAAQEREKAIREMGVIALSTDPFTVLEGIAALYDAGYRR